MGRHSRKDSAPARPAPAVESAPEELRRESVRVPAHGAPFDPFGSASHPPREERPAGHPQQREPGGAWGAGTRTAGDTAYGDWRGVPRTRVTAPPPPVRDCDTPAFGVPVLGFPVPAAEPTAEPGTGTHRRFPGPRGPLGTPEPDPGPGSAPPSRPPSRTDSVTPAPEAEAEAEAEVEVESESAAETEAGSGSGRGTKIRTYTGMAAAAVTTVLAVVVAGQMIGQNDSDATPTRAAADSAKDRPGDGQSSASRSEGRATPEVAQAEPTYEQKMAQQLPIDAKLTGPGLFDTVPGVAKAPGKGKLLRYRVDVEQGLGMDGQLFAEAVHRTLNDPRSWAHGGEMTFERVPGGESDFVITLASPGTTGAWCAKSGLDTTVDNVSCDSAATERVMINAFRWAQGSPTYGADQMFAYRQMLINHEVGHRLGHGHVNCRTPGALAPIMQQQTKSLDVDNIPCKPNPWVYPGN
ncbi:DUF3152 domain-containing protein [Streptomyces sp. NPDC091259]|uniref:DUF3152 domain-containing protein n=1 Tax=Streptomyces sp. NPDC091259 TaxID=3365976 RepID=UPI0038162435